MPGCRDLPKQFRQYFSCQLFSQFYTPLVKWVDVPYYALGKYLMFIKCDQHTQRMRVELVEEQGGSRLVAGENLVRQQGFQRFILNSLRLKFSARFFASFAQHQCFGLGKAVG